MNVNRKSKRHYTSEYLDTLKWKYVSNVDKKLLGSTMHRFSRHWLKAYIKKMRNKND